MSYAARGPGTGIDAKASAATPPTQRQWNIDARREVAG